MAKTRAQVTPRIYVVLDSNALFTDAADKLLSLEISKFITDDTKALGLDIRWCIPSCVKEERRHQMLERGMGLLIPLSKLESLLGHSLAMSPDILSSRVDDAIRRQMDAHGLFEISLDISNANWISIIQSAFSKQPPFSPTGEKGFKDAIVLETFTQLVGNNPKTPSISRNILLTSDALLQIAAKERTKDFRNVAIASTIEDLRTLLNAVASHLPQNVVEELVPKATAMFWDPAKQDGLYNKWEIFNKIYENSSSIIDTPYAGFTSVKRTSIGITQTTFLEKDRTKVKFSTSMYFNVTSSKYISDASQNAAQMAALLSSLLKNTQRNDPKESNQQHDLAKFNLLSPQQPSSTSTPPTTRIDRKGSHFFIVHWMATLSPSGKLTNPVFEGVSHQRTAWGETDETVES